ncbi:hypothetical protein ACFQ08_05330 [Streptosporangium algeriense]|uniref:Uncharacterized protein n=1 Tax=Streptosporangium algeriense TaxID=1682748 RepID=A0ABW3DJN5_9ACTN
MTHTDEASCSTAVEHVLDVRHDIPDLHEETHVDTMTQAVEAILDALDDRDLTTAREHFRKAVYGSPSAVTGLLKRLAATVAIPAGLVVVGFGIDIWANPHRADYAWRCGGTDCRWTGSNYRSMQAARAAAEEHAHDHQADGTPVPVVVEYGSSLHTERAPSLMSTGEGQSSTKGTRR